MSDAVIVDAVRSPMGKGKPGGALSGLHSVELLAQTLRGLFDRIDVDPTLVDDVLIGCVSQVNEQGQTPGRWAWLAAGLPETVPAATIDRRCGSGQQAADFAAYGIRAGAYELVVAGGVESMSRVPMGSARVGADPIGPSASARYGGMVGQGISAELVAARWKISREELDAYAVTSHMRAAEAAQTGGFGPEIVPIQVPGEEGDDGHLVDADETIRPGSTIAKLAGLEPVFRDAAIHERFPEIDWSVTAGNASQITDGASALLIASEETASRLDLEPIARFHSFAVAGVDPIEMLTAPLPATERVLHRSGLGIHEIDHVEVNEAFASVPLAWHRTFDIDPDRVNPRGGAIALGHPLGASGARLLTTMVHALQQTGGRYGLQTMCEAGGMANATIIERL